MSEDKRYAENRAMHGERGAQRFPVQRVPQTV
jgi:hypothetical protein